MVATGDRDVTKEQAVCAEVVRAYISLSRAHETVHVREEGAGLVGRRHDAVVAPPAHRRLSRFDLPQSRARLA